MKRRVRSLTPHSPAGSKDGRTRYRVANARFGASLSSYCQRCSTSKHLEIHAAAAVVLKSIESLLVSRHVWRLSCPFRKRGKKATRSAPSPRPTEQLINSKYNWAGRRAAGRKRVIISALIRLHNCDTLYCTPAAFPSPSPFLSLSLLGVAKGALLESLLLPLAACGPDTGSPLTLVL